MTELKLNLHKALFHGIEKHTNHGCIQFACETGIPVWAPKLWHSKITFQFLFFQLYFNKKYVEVAINDFTMHQIISKWLGGQKCRQKKRTMRQKYFEKKEEIVYESVFVYLNM